VFSVEEFRRIEQQTAELVTLPLTIGRALEKGDWPTVKKLSARTASLRFDGYLVIADGRLRALAGERRSVRPACRLGPRDSALRGCAPRAHGRLVTANATRRPVDRRQRRSY
jgi:hypothetical protein